MVDKRRRSDAALAAVAAAVCGLFVTVAVGGPVYGVLPAAVAHELALGAGAPAAAVAVLVWQRPRPLPDLRTAPPAMR